MRRANSSNSQHHRCQQPMPLLLSLLTVLTTLPGATLAQQQQQQQQQPNPKRGISWIGTSSSSHDNGIFTSDRGSTPLSWYKSWGATPIGEPYLQDLEFVPMIHGLDNLEGDVRTIAGLPASSGNEEGSVLTFNEPDGDTSGGGTAISADDAARAWAQVVTLRDGGGGGDQKRGRRLSSPATTGSESGWEWLQAWNQSCWELYEDTGCEFDFVAAHWYGSFEGLAAWVGRLREAWPDKDVWVTELALPQPATSDQVLGMMNQSLGFLDETEWIARYAWFGAFREDEANGWTGDVVALLDDDGGLTELGVLYMGGEERGFKVGESESEGGAAAVGIRRVGWCLVVSAVVFAMLLIELEF